MASIERNKIVKYCIKLMYLFVFYEYTDHILDMVNNNHSGFNIIPPRIKLNTRFAHNMLFAYMGTFINHIAYTIIRKIRQIHQQKRAFYIDNRELQKKREKRHCQLTHLNMNREYLQ